MVIITTVGTSLLTNLTKSDIQKSFKTGLSGTVINKIKNGSLTSSISSVDDAIELHINGNACHPKDKHYDINLGASAEIKSICKIANRNQATVYLLATDTFTSEYSAKKIREHIDGKEKLIVKEPIRITGLEIDQPDKFESIGFEKLITEFEKIKKNHEDEKIILNISGGYKALIPFLTIYAQIKKLKLQYIYENSSKLIEITPLELNFDWALMEALRPYLTESINANKLGPNNSKIIESLVKNKLILSEGGDNYSLSSLGQLLKSSFHSNTNLSNNILGTFLEYKYFEYFLTKSCFVQLSVNEYDINYTYEFNPVKNTFTLNFDGKETLSKKAKAGDIDLLIQNKNKVETSLIEVKNYHTFLSYREKMLTEDDYYRKVKGKIEAFKYKSGKLPSAFIFIVNLILFEKAPSAHFEENPDFMTVARHFKSRIDKDYNNNISLEVKLCKFDYVSPEKLKVNYPHLLSKKVEDHHFINIPQDSLKTISHV